MRDRFPGMPACHLTSPRTKNLRTPLAFPPAGFLMLLPDAAANRMPAFSPRENRRVRYWEPRSPCIRCDII
jgi:hypothetical protein